MIFINAILICSYCPTGKLWDSFLGTRPSFCACVHCLTRPLGLTCTCLLHTTAYILVSCKPPTGQCLSHRDKDYGTSQFHPYKTNFFLFCTIKYEFNGNVSVCAVSWNVASDKRHCECRWLLAFSTDTEVWLWLSTFHLFIYRHIPHKGLVGTRSLTGRNTKGFLLSSCLSPCILFSYYLFNDVLRLHKFSAE